MGVAVAGVEGDSIILGLGLVVPAIVVSGVLGGVLAIVGEAVGTAVGAGVAAGVSTELGVAANVTVGVAAGIVTAGVLTGEAPEFGLAVAAVVLSGVTSGELGVPAYSRGDLKHQSQLVTCHDAVQHHRRHDKPHLQ